MKKLFIGALIALAATSCATILSGSTAKITLVSPDVDRADVAVDGNYYRDLQFPAQIEVSRGFDSSLITVSTETKEGMASVKKGFNEISLFNILLGGLPGFLIDAATGSITKPTQDTYIIYMFPKKSTEEIVIPYLPGQQNNI